MASLRSCSNASSGMGVADDCKDTFLEFQRKKTHRYVIFKIDEKQKEVIVEKVGAATECYDEFMASLPEKDCRYAVYDFNFVTEENCQKSKISFIAWVNLFLPSFIFDMDITCLHEMICWIQNPF